jgi:hypothetical protein
MKHWSEQWTPDNLALRRVAFVVGFAIYLLLSWLVELPATEAAHPIPSLAFRVLAGVGALFIASMVARWAELLWCAWRERQREGT